MSSPPAQAPLAGRTIVVDAGHQLGNALHPREIATLVDAGEGQTKVCNTTGTATNAGYPEATFTFAVATAVERRLERMGAQVVLTRRFNSADRWGPCVDVRGRAGNDERAALKVSIHGDGSSPNNRGFHVIVSTNEAVLSKASLAFAQDVRSSLEGEGFRRSNYIGGGTALSLRGDLATLNLSEIPTVMVELGNMRSADDAAVMSSEAGKERYATALTAAVLKYFARS